MKKLLQYEKTVFILCLHGNISRLYKNNVVQIMQCKNVFKHSDAIFVSVRLQPHTQTKTKTNTHTHKDQHIDLLCLNKTRKHTTECSPFVKRNCEKQV